jgi:hydroxyethylthiazole kinase-like uncharacterized protein yjeF
VSGIPVLTPEELRGVEARALSAKRGSLMELAGRSAADAARRMAADTGAPVLVVAGPGNNGGDAWVAAAHLLGSFHRVVVFDVKGETPKAAEAQAAKSVFTSRGGSIVRAWPASPRPSLVIDGLLGLGLARDVDADFAAIIERINAFDAPVLALDVPSGLDSRTGRVRGAAVRATRTITFIARKVGLHTLEGPDHCGAIECDELGTAEDVRAIARGWLLTPEYVAPWLAPRHRNTHKGDFGSVAILGGNRGMVGAALLAARAALYAGAGKVRVGLLSPDALTADPVQPELMFGSIDDALATEVLVAGPGAGRSPSATSVSMFERSVMPNAIAAPKPLVLDADALNAVAFNEGLAGSLANRRNATTILTPHPAEAARMLGKTTEEVQSDRLAAALDLARRFRAHVVLKGAGSICAFPDGRWSVNSTGNPGLSAAGSGDVLAGIIAALLAQKLDAERALQYAVCLHGAAADACVARGDGPIGLTASEVAREARALINRWVSKNY